MVPVRRIVSARLGTLAPVRSMIDGFALFGLRIRGWWMPAIVFLAVPWLLALCVEWRIVVPWRQYLGVFPGDLFLAAAFGWAIFLAWYYTSVSPRPVMWYRRKAYHLASLAVGLAFTGSFLYGEFVNMKERHHPSAAYTEPQFWSPTNVFHYVLVVLGVYLTLTLVVPVLAYVQAPEWTKVGIAILLLGWALCAVYLDNTLPRPNLEGIHPLNGGWFGGFGLQLWHRLFG